MMLESKTAIVYGGAGAIGSAVARAFAREGARVFLAGRTVPALNEVAEGIRSTGGLAEVAQLDVLDRTAVDAHAASVAGANDGIDIAFNATSNDDVQGTPLVDLTYSDFIRPVTKSVTAHFNIATAVARHMTIRGSGAILVMAGGREAIPSLGGSHVAWSALAGLCRQLAADLGPHGVRVAWLLSPGSPDPADEGTHDPNAPAGLLGRRPTLDDVANVATFLASGWASTMTATEVNITGGAVID
ncbi:SDR family NAD(P)-dependent oxidoreductase [Actinomadura rudentiformis]|uniref:SDR family oxidoreductase n=1 Tax=Actinomadura rudentiformis TaxID=359158 RepID=A0A6H9YL96_9ACTN|nr:SDR family oxidoreductase [Actinomadura rudentiformis]KAB2347988.1 SDR family oxidoreductase [Actinomadura rudentiformis]